jgi:hypothetical protein
VFIEITPINIIVLQKHILIEQWLKYSNTIEQMLVSIYKKASIWGTSKQEKK